MPCAFRNILITYSKPFSGSEAIPRYVDEVAFLENKMVQDAVIRNIEIIGEAARNIERYHPDFAIAHPEVPWEDIYLMRNRVANGYFSVDFEIVWKSIQNDLPELQQQILQLQKSC